MERNETKVLRENNNFESPNTSLKNQLNISVTDVDEKKVNGEYTTKENYSPRSLSALAADKSSRHSATPQQLDNTNTSTPKPAKKQDTSDFDPDVSVDITPKYNRALLDHSVKDASLSFLTAGLGNLGLGTSEGERSNFTLSDDDDAFQECQSSLSDLSGIKSNEDEANKTLEDEVASPGSGNDTLTLGTNMTLDKTQIKSDATFDGDIVKDKTVDLTNDKTVDLFNKTVDLINDKTVDLGNKTVDLINDKTVDLGNKTVDLINDMTVDLGNKTVDFVNDKTVDLSGTEEVKFALPEIRIEEPEAQEATKESEAKEISETFVPSMVTNSPETITEVPQILSHPEVLEISSKSADNSTRILELSQNSSHNFDNSAEQEMYVAVNNADEHRVPDQNNDHSTFPEIEVNVSSARPSSTDVSKEAAESTLPDSPAPESAEDPDVTMEDISEDRQNLISSFPEVPVQYTEVPVQYTEVPVQYTEVPVQAATPEPKEVQEKSPEPEIVYRNIDESGRWDKAEDMNKSNDHQQIPSTADKVFTEKVESSFDVQFKMPAPVFFKPQNEVQPPQQVTDADFGCGSSYNFAESDFDYLNNFGSTEERNSLFNRDSVLLKFDPLLSRPVPVNKRLSGTKEEVDDFVKDLALKLPVKEELEESFGSDQLLSKENEMSVSAVEIMKDYSTVGENKTQESTFISEAEDSGKLGSHNISGEYLEKMSELENKMKKEAELREEQLLKRISEKDKQIVKMNGVVEAYEKAISELIAEKEQLVQSYDRKCVDLKTDSEQNANHLASLETTFSDLHAKYERTKQVAQELNEREKMVLQDRKTLTESLKMQEARYDKMKSHAMSQLEIANSTLAEINRNHHAEVTKLKALLKKEEISRASVNEQLIQKSKENSELVKICDELINGTQS